MSVTEHQLLSDFQPFNIRLNFGLGYFVTAGMNWAALFGVAYVVGKGLRLGLGL